MHYLHTYIVPRTHISSNHLKSDLRFMKHKKPINSIFSIDCLNWKMNDTRVALCLISAKRLFLVIKIFFMINYLYIHTCICRCIPFTSFRNCLCALYLAFMVKDDSFVFFASFIKQEQSTIRFGITVLHCSTLM